MLMIRDHPVVKCTSKVEGDGLALRQRDGCDQQVTLHRARIILGWATVCRQLYHLGM